MTGSLVVERLSIASGAARIVADVDFTIGPGAPVTLLGETGSGKSLVMHAIMGSLPDTLQATGSIALGGRELLALGTRERRALWGRELSLLPQEPWLALEPTMRLAAQVAEPHRLVRGRSPAQARELARDDLAGAGLADAERLYPFQMSGGMCQRAAIAILHGTDSGLILADEPTKSLDAQFCEIVVGRLRDEVARGRLLLTITHDIAVARGIGGTVAVIQRGRIVECGDVEAVLSAPAHPFTRSLLAAEPVHWKPRTRSIHDSPAVIEAHDLACAVGGRTLFAGLNLAIRPGEIVALTAPSGTGKTILGNTLLGLVTPASGTVTRSPTARRVQFQKIYQDPPASFAPHQRLGRGVRDLMARHAIAPHRLPPMLDALALDTALLDRLPGEVSGGELQRLAIARALLVDPVFLLADEATSRLDLIWQRQVMLLLTSLARDRELALLIVTHDLALADRTADRVIDLARAVLCSHA